MAVLKPFLLICTSACLSDGARPSVSSVADIREITQPANYQHEMQFWLGFFYRKAEQQEAAAVLTDITATEAVVGAN